MMLPRGWAETTLENIGDLYCGQSVSKVDVNKKKLGNIYVTGPEQWDGKSIEINKWTEKAKKLAPSGSIFITVKGAGVGKMFPGIECAIGRDIYAYSPDKITNQRFIYLSLQMRISQIVRKARGDIPGLSAVHLTKHSIPLPPLAEQRRIVAKLDSLTARIARTRAELERVKKLSADLRNQALQAAFTGSLPTNLKNSFEQWETRPFAEIGEIASNLVSPQEIQNLPHVAPNHIRSGIPGAGGFVTIREDKVVSSKNRFFPGQIIYSKIRPNLRKVAIVDFDGGCSADMYPINARCNAKYLMYWMISPQFTDMATKSDGRTVLPKINQKALNAIPTPVPSLKTQQTVAQTLDSVFGRSGRFESEAQRALTLLGRLESALLAKAFRGELVPQDPNDEPASALLDLIRAERQAAPKTRRTRKT